MKQNQYDNQFANDLLIEQMANPSMSIIPQPSKPDLIKYSSYYQPPSQNQHPSQNQQIQQQSQLLFQNIEGNRVANGHAKPNKIEIEDLTATKIIIYDDQQIEKKVEIEIDRITRQSQKTKNSSKSKATTISKKKNQQSSNLSIQRQYHYCKCQAGSCNKSKCSCRIRGIKCKNGCKCVPKVGTCNNPFNYRNLESIQIIQKSENIAENKNDTKNIDKDYQICQNNPESQPVQFDISNIQSQNQQIIHNQQLLQYIQQKVRQQVQEIAEKKQNMSQEQKLLFPLDSIKSRGKNKSVKNVDEVNHRFCKGDESFDQLKCCSLRHNTSYKKECSCRNCNNPFEETNQSDQ